MKPDFLIGTRSNASKESKALKDSKVFYIYSDASFSKEKELAIIGYAIFKSKHEHETLGLFDIALHTKQIQESNNIRAEVKGAIEALEFCIQTFISQEALEESSAETANKIILYCDCQTICGLLSRRKKLESENFISQSKNRLLSNADLYQKFYKLFDLINFKLNYKMEIVWIKGHSSSKNKSLNFVDKNFSFLDKEVRKKLRIALLKKT